MKKFEENKIYCPVCEHELAVTHRDRYQDLTDHVSNPNGSPSMKDGYQCVNKKCFVSESFYAWIEDGDLFCLKDSYKTRASDKDKLLSFSKSGQDYALNSFNHYYHLGKSEIARKTKKISLGKYKIVIIPKEYGWDHSQEKRYMPKPFSWKFEYWIRTSEHSYQNLIPHHRMIAYRIKEFNRCYRAFIENGAKSNLSDCIKSIEGLDYFNKKDERFYVRVSSLLIRILYPGKCELIRGINKNKNNYETR